MTTFVTYLHITFKVEGFYLDRLHSLLQHITQASCIGLATLIVGSNTGDRIPLQIHFYIMSKSVPEISTLQALELVRNSEDGCVHLANHNTLAND